MRDTYSMSGNVRFWYSIILWKVWLATDRLPTNKSIHGQAAYSMGLKFQHGFRIRGTSSVGGLFSHYPRRLPDDDAIYMQAPCPPAASTTPSGLTISRRKTGR
ncbi:hypothetical protein KCP70_20890 [Salmonella enterica subsp. enterica]|nr:hypothetical protein KCP70_20890 [Salmonella enterica subsp. enterica]